VHKRPPPLCAAQLLEFAARLIRTGVALLMDTVADCVFTET
jgi:hypothetical protein